MASVFAAVCVVSLLSIGSPLRAEEGLFMRGDANLDAAISISDVFAVFRHLALGQPVRCRDAADANDDGVLNLVDPILVVSVVFRLGGALPPPFYSPGNDLTDDALDCESSLASNRLKSRAKTELENDEPCHPQDDGGGIADLEFVSFLRPVKVMPGQSNVLVPLFLSTGGHLEGFTLAFQAPVGQIALESFHFEGRLYEASRTPAWADVLDGMTHEGRLAVNVVMSNSPPFDVIPNLRHAALGFLEFSVSQDAQVGDEFLVRFSDIPGEDGYQPVRNDFSRFGVSIPFGVCPLVVQVVSPAELFIRGDTNRDWRVNITDVLTILRGLFGGGASHDGVFACADAADVSDDGRVDVNDAVRLLSHLFASGPPPESPYPQPGQDTVVPESSPLTCGGH